MGHWSNAHQALATRASSDPLESDWRSSFLFGRIFCDEPVATSSENALVELQNNGALVKCSSGSGHARFYCVPNHLCNVGAAMLLDVADTGWRGDVDFREVGANYVDAGEDEATPLEFRP